MEEVPKELYISLIQRKCNVGYVQGIAVQKFAMEYVSQILQQLRQDMEGMGKTTDGTTVYATPDDGFNEAIDQALQVIDKHLNENQPQKDR